MNHLNNFYFKMLVKSAKMTNNMNNDKIFKDVILYFQDTAPMILPHVWLSNGQNAKWNEVYCKLIKDHFIKETIYLVKSIKNIDINYHIVEDSFDRRTICRRIFIDNGLYDDEYNKFYYK